MLVYQMVLQKGGRKKAQGIYVTLAILAYIQMTNFSITPAYSFCFVLFFVIGKYKFTHRILRKYRNKEILQEKRTLGMIFSHSPFEGEVKN